MEVGQNNHSGHNTESNCFCDLLSISITSFDLYNDHITRFFENNVGKKTIL